MSGSLPHILKIGVTGGIGSGKTTVCRFLRNSGIPTISADEIAHRITDSDPLVQKRLRNILGPKAFDRRGRMNRTFVAERLFGNRRIQASIERVVHPAVERRIKIWMSTLARSGKKLAVVEAALVFEAGMDRWLNAVVVVTAKSTLRIRRITKRDRIPGREVARRINAQWSTERKLRKADIVIENDGTVAALRKKTAFLAAIMKCMAQRKKHG